MNEMTESDAPSKSKDAAAKAGQGDYWYGDCTMLRPARRSNMQRAAVAVVALW